MKKRTTLLLCSFVLLSSLRAQDIGFRTTDIGGEYQHYDRGSIYNLHVAFNAKLNHSILVRLGYNQVSRYQVDDHTEFGNGWGGGIGYRYYFKPFPYKLFIGARVDIWSMKIHMDFSPANGPAYFPQNTAIVHPALETGYTFVINDMVFFTPNISAGFHTDFGQLKTVRYGNGFVTTFGASAGIRL